MLLLSLIIINGCKKDKSDTLNSKEQNRKILVEEYIKMQSSNSSSNGDCMKKLADSTVKWTETYGAGGPKDSTKYQYERERAFSRFIDQMLECSGTFRGANIKNPPLLPPAPVIDADEVFSLHEVQGFLNYFGVPSLCDQQRVDIFRAYIAPLNVIINRAAINFGTRYYNDTIDPLERFEMILNNVQSNEHYLIEDQEAIKYFYVISTFKFPISHIVAQKLLDLPLSFVGSVGANGLYSSIQPWNGFLIDCSQTSLSPYCSIGQIFLPNPLPSGSESIYYQIDYNLIQQDVPQLDTHIFQNPFDLKYYSNSNPYTTLIVDGYYDSPSEVLGNNHKYYHVIDGYVKEVINVIKRSGPN